MMDVVANANGSCTLSIMIFSIWAAKIRNVILWLAIDIISIRGEACRDEDSLTVTIALCELEACGYYMGCQGPPCAIIKFNLLRLPFI